MTGGGPTKPIPVAFEAHFSGEFAKCRVAAYRGGVQKNSSSR